MSVVTIPLTRGAVSIIDAEDAPRVAALKWRLVGKGKHRYAARWFGGPQRKRLVGLHRFILDAADGVIVDHVNGDGLDNRRCNLRVATQAENLRNRLGAASHSATGVLGVRHRYGRYQPYITVDGRRKNLGSFATMAEAIAARRAAEVKYHGRFASSLGATSERHP